MGDSDADIIILSSDDESKPSNQDVANHSRKLRSRNVSGRNLTVSTKNELKSKMNLKNIQSINTLQKTSNLTPERLDTSYGKTKIIQLPINKPENLRTHSSVTFNKQTPKVSVIPKHSISSHQQHFKQIPSSNSVKQPVSSQQQHFKQISSLNSAKQPVSTQQQHFKQISSSTSSQQHYKQIPSLNSLKQSVSPQKQYFKQIPSSNSLKQSISSQQQHFKQIPSPNSITQPNSCRQQHFKQIPSSKSVKQPISHQQQHSRQTRLSNSVQCVQNTKNVISQGSDKNKIIVNLNRNLQTNSMTVGSKSSNSVSVSNASTISKKNVTALSGNSQTDKDNPVSSSLIGLFQKNGISISSLQKCGISAMQVANDSKDDLKVPQSNVNHNKFSVKENNVKNHPVLKTNNKPNIRTDIIKSNSLCQATIKVNNRKISPTDASIPNKLSCLRKSDSLSGNMTVISNSNSASKSAYMSKTSEKLQNKSYDRFGISSVGSLQSVNRQNVKECSAKSVSSIILPTKHASLVNNSKQTQSTSVKVNIMDKNKKYDTLKNTSLPLKTQNPLISLPIVNKNVVNNHCKPKTQNFISNSNSVTMKCAASLSNTSFLNSPLSVTVADSVKKSDICKKVIQPVSSGEKNISQLKKSDQLTCKNEPSRVNRKSIELTNDRKALLNLLALCESNESEKKAVKSVKSTINKLANVELIELDDSEDTEKQNAKPREVFINNEKNSFVTPLEGIKQCDIFPKLTIKLKDVPDRIRHWSKPVVVLERIHALNEHIILNYNLSKSLSKNNSVARNNSLIKPETDKINKRKGEDKCPLSQNFNEFSENTTQHSENNSIVLSDLINENVTVKPIENTVALLSKSGITLSEVVNKPVNVGPAENTMQQLSYNQISLSESISDNISLKPTKNTKTLLSNNCMTLSNGINDISLKQVENYSNQSSNSQITLSKFVKQDVHLKPLKIVLARLPNDDTVVSRTSVTNDALSDLTISDSSKVVKNVVAVNSVATNEILLSEPVSNDANLKPAKHTEGLLPDNCLTLSKTVNGNASLKPVENTMQQLSNNEIISLQFANEDDDLKSFDNTITQLSHNKISLSESVNDSVSLTKNAKAQLSNNCLTLSNAINDNINLKLVENTEHRLSDNQITLSKSINDDSGPKSFENTRTHVSNNCLSLSNVVYDNVNLEPVESAETLLSKNMAIKTGQMNKNEFVNEVAATNDICFDLTISDSSKVVKNVLTLLSSVVETYSEMMNNVHVDENKSFGNNGMDLEPYENSVRKECTSDSNHSLLEDRCKETDNNQMLRVASNFIINSQQSASVVSSNLVEELYNDNANFPTDKYSAVFGCESNLIKKEESVSTVNENVAEVQFKPSDNVINISEVTSALCDKDNSLLNNESPENELMGGNSEKDSDVKQNLQSIRFQEDVDIDGNLSDKHTKSSHLNDKCDIDIINESSFVSDVNGKSDVDMTNETNWASDIDEPNVSTNQVTSPKLSLKRNRTELTPDRKFKGSADQLSPERVPKKIKFDKEAVFNEDLVTSPKLSLKRNRAELTPDRNFERSADQLSPERAAKKIKFDKEKEVFDEKHVTEEPATICGIDITPSIVAHLGPSTSDAPQNQVIELSDDEIEPIPPLIDDGDSSREAIQVISGWDSPENGNEKKDLFEERRKKFLKVLDVSAELMGTDASDEEKKMIVNKLVNQLDTTPQSYVESENFDLLLDISLKKMERNNPNVFDILNNVKKELKKHKNDGKRKIINTVEDIWISSNDDSVSKDKFVASTSSLPSKISKADFDTSDTNSVSRFNDTLKIFEKNQLLQDSASCSSMNFISSKIFASNKNSFNDSGSNSQIASNSDKKLISNNFIADCFSPCTSATTLKPPTKSKTSEFPNFNSYMTEKSADFASTCEKSIKDYFTTSENSATNEKLDLSSMQSKNNTNDSVSNFQTIANTFSSSSIASAVGLHPVETNISNYQSSVVEKLNSMKHTFVASTSEVYLSSSSAAASRNTVLENDVNTPPRVPNLSTKFLSKEQKSCTNSRSSSSDSRVTDRTLKSNEDERKKKNIRKLENLLKTLDKEIKKFQKADLSLDDLDDEHSPYVQESKYKARFVKAYNMLCKLQKVPARTGRIVEKKFHYEGSRYRLINEAIEKCINKKKAHQKFPDYSEVLNLIRQVEDKHNLGLDDVELSIEAKRIFEDIGELLKERRIRDEKELLGCYLTDDLNLDDDPAEKDERMKKILEENSKKSKENLNQVIDHYAEKQKTMPEEEENAKDDDEDEVEDEDDEKEDEDDDGAALDTNNDSDDLPRTAPASPAENDGAPVVNIRIQDDDDIEVINYSDRSTDDEEKVRERKTSTVTNPVILESVIIEDSESSGDLPSLQELIANTGTDAVER